MVVFLDFPSFSAVMGLLALPVKRVRLYLTERPPYGQAVGIQTAQDDTVALTPALGTDNVIELRIYKNHTPLLECRIEEPNGRSNRPFLRVVGWIADPEVRYCATIHDPAEQQLSLFMEDGPVIAVERKLGIPSAHETVKGLSLFSQRRIRSS